MSPMSPIGLMGQMSQMGLMGLMGLMGQVSPIGLMGQMSQMGPMYLMYQLFYETWLKGSDHRYKLSLFLLGVYIRAEGARNCAPTDALHVSSQRMENLSW